MRIFAGRKENRMLRRGADYIKWMLPLLFVWYYSSVMLYMHTHVEEGMMISHSHPFKDVAHHHQSLSEILFFQNISSVKAEDGAVSPVYLPPSFSLLICILVIPVVKAIHSIDHRTAQLRAPPYLND